MKKVFFVSLLLVSIFLIGSSGKAFANGECQWYQCSGKYLCLDGESGEWEDCVEICIDEGSARIGSPYWFGCDLGGISLFGSNKNFVGVGDSTEGLLGCSVSLRGRSMTVDLYEIESIPPCLDQLKCVKNDECI
jgi:hypothetical protein